MDQQETRSPTPHMPVYPNARHFLRIINGTPYALYWSTYKAILDQRGSPQETVTWADPDRWIAERLNGDERALAFRIWRESNQELNPRYLRGSWYLVTKRNLLDRDKADVLEITERGQQFLDEPQGLVVAETDSYEGILTILSLVAERGPGKRSEFLSGYADYCRAFTSYRSVNVIKGSLYDRLMNLIDRQYIVRRGQTYAVTRAGLGYLERYAHLIPGRVVGTKHAELQRLARELSQEAREQFAEFLSRMNPYKFESLIQLLLEEMGYTSVEVTSPVNDKGVDVVANIELGISSVREVVQAKRYKGNITRPVLDQLRGALHRFGAVRGTIITTGGFSKGTVQAAFEGGAAPITLIDGEKLLDLLMDHGIGVTKSPIEYIEFDPERLAQFESEEAEEPEE